MKKMIIFFLFPVLAVCCCNNQQQAISQPASEADVVTAIDQLMKGMIAADENILKAFLTDELVYVHSNGRVQSKSDLITEILSDERRFLSIETLDQTIQMGKDAAVVQHIFAAETKNKDGELGSLRVNIMQVWQLQNGNWKLLARQGYKL